MLNYQSIVDSRGAGPALPIARVELFVQQVLRAARLAAGACVITTSAVKVASAVLGSSSAPWMALMDVWVLTAGVLMVLIEDFRFTGDFRRGLTRRRLYYYCRFLFLPPGRGYLYLVVACLLLARPQEGAATPWVAVFVGAMAVAYTVMGHVVALRMERVKQAFASEAVVCRDLQGFHRGLGAERGARSGGSGSAARADAAGASDAAPSPAFAGSTSVAEHELSQDDFRRFCAEVQKPNERNACLARVACSLSTGR